MGTTFEPARKFGVSPRNYESYWDGVDDTPTMPVGQRAAAPQGAAQPVQPAPAAMFGVGDNSGGSMQLSPYDPLGDQDEEQKFQEYLMQRDARKNAMQQIQNGDVDFNGASGVSKMQNWAATGAVDPKTLTTIHALRADRNRTASDNLYTPPPPEVASGVQMIRQVNPESETAMDDLIGVTRAIPAEHQTNPHFTDAYKSQEAKIQASRIARQRMALTASNHKNYDDELKAKVLMEGVLRPEQLAAHINEDGSLNRETIQMAIGQAKINKDLMTPEVRKELHALAVAKSTPPSDAEKEQYLTQNGVNPEAATGEQWDIAYKAMKALKEKAHRNAWTQLEAMGYRQLPARTQGAVAQPTQTNKIIVIDPKGRQHAFDWQEDADTFKKKAGIP